MSVDRILLIVFLLIAAANISDVIADYHMAVDTWHLIIEGITVVISLVAFFILWNRIARRNLELTELKVSLQRHQQQPKTTEKKPSMTSYGSVKHHFDQWQLSPSEQEVAVLLLKGLSLSEIAGVRNTKEKTVRQQASAIYAKSELNGRNQLSAWFIDALLE